MRSPLVAPREPRPRVQMDPPSFFKAVHLAFEQAAHAAATLPQFDYQISGYHVRLRFAGPTLTPYLTPALAHLATSDERQPDLVIDLWETATCGIAPPPPPWDYDDFGGSGLIRSFTTEQLYTYFQFGTNALSLVDMQNNRAVFWIKSASQLPSYEKGAPLRAILSLWLNRHGRALVHSGAVGLPEGGVLLAGAGGSGKSNTSLAALTSDLLYAADDYSLVAVDPEPAVFSLYSTGKTKAADLSRLPFLQSSISNPHELEQEKALYFLHERWPEKLIKSFPLRAVLLPHVAGGRDSRLRPAGAAEGLNALAPSTLGLAPNIEQASFKLLVEVFRRVPCFHLDLGTERDQPARLILDLLRQHRH